MEEQDARPNRRRMLRWMGRGVVYGGMGLALADAWWLEPKRVVVERHSVPLANLPSAFEGFRIVQMSDFHRGRVVSAEHVRKAVRLANDLHPDLVCLTGDYVSGSEQYAGSCAEALRELCATHGVYAVLGNHDHWTDAALVTRELQSAGVSVLENQWTAIRHEGEAISLVGIDDVWEKKADLTGAMQGVPETRPVVLLVHEPDFADEVRKHPMDLQLSGHSHGGQVWLPFVGAPVLPPFGRKYPRGWRRLGALQLYTNRGVGMVAPPLRFNCPAEVALFELVSA